MMNDNKKSSSSVSSSTSRSKKGSSVSSSSSSVSKSNSNSVSSTSSKPIELDSKSRLDFVANVRKTGEDIKKVLSETPTSDIDKTGFYHISSSIADIIKNPNSEPPFNIGIIGKYGSGKTKIVEQIKSSLKLGEHSQKIIDKIVEFDVGRYHESRSIWAALILEFFKAFSKEKGIVAPLKYFCSLPIKKKIINTILLISSILLSIFFIWWSYISFSVKLEYLYRFFLILFAGGISVIFCINNLYKLWSHPIVMESVKQIFVLSTNSIEKTIKERLELETKLRILFNAWAPKICDRIVLVIDNLDRCNSDKVIEIVDELYALISTEGVREKLICIIAVDDTALEKSLRKKELETTQDYFEKLFTLKIKVPSLNKELLSLFLEEILELPSGIVTKEEISNSYNMDDNEITQEEAFEIRRQLNNYLIEGGTLTPRKIKRIVFSYQFLKYLWARWQEGRSDFAPKDIINCIICYLNGTPVPNNISQKIKKFVEIVSGSSKEIQIN